MSLTAIGLSVASLAFLAAPARAAMLTQVNDWNGGVTGLPPDVSMYIYVPDQVAAKAPILTLVHYCGGTAPAVFGQAQGGGIVSAANQYGFILVVPSSGRYWDVQSNKKRQRDGGGDSQAIRQRGSGLPPSAAQRNFTLPYRTPALPGSFGTPELSAEAPCPTVEVCSPSLNWNSDLRRRARRTPVQ